MAIIEGIPGLSVVVRVDGEPLVEYSNNDGENIGNSPTQTVIKYIEAITDKKFDVVINATKEFRFTSPQVAHHVLVDGILARSTMGSKSPYCCRVSSLTVRRQKDKRVTRSLRFSSLTVGR
jgi:hypothetical protein